MSTKDYYSILGVSRRASDAEIKRAYRALAKKYHPDVNKGDKGAEERFKDITESYQVLSDKKKKQEYDMFGASGMGGGFRPGGASYTYQGGPQGGFDFSTFTSGGTGAGFEGLDDLFGDLFGMGGVGQKKGMGRKGFRGQRSARPVRGADRTYGMEIDFLDAVKGKTSKISIPMGSKVQKLNVKIPAGVKTGSKIRLAGKGDGSINNGPSGDLYIEIKVRSHPYFTREENDIYLKLPITLQEAIQGASIEVPTIEGKLKMKIPEGTQGGQKFRLKGKGVLASKGANQGDQYVVVNLALPEKVDQETHRIVEEFSKKNPISPREGLF